MSSTRSQSRPAWQTEELQDEWIEQDDDDDFNNLSYGTQSISFTAPLASHIQTNLSESTSPSNAPSNTVGTFVVREDIPTAPLLPKTPGRNKKPIMKDFFSALPLERLFDPPTPPSGSMFQPPGPGVTLQDSESRPTNDQLIEMGMSVEAVSEPKASIDCQFTFAIPHDTSPKPISELRPGGAPQAQSTPAPPFAPNRVAPLTDPRLRLFQFQYDTFTRDHLSAMVDSIAVNTPSGGSGTGTPSPASFFHGPQATGPRSHLRSIKRVKLSPKSDFYGEGDGAGAMIARPKLFRKDYVGESQSLMQKIKQARDFSTISTVASAQSGSPATTRNGDDASNTKDQFSIKPMPASRGTSLISP